MKKALILITITTSLFFASCSSGSGFEADVRKMAGYSCEFQKILNQGDTDEKAKVRLESLQKEMEEFGKKMEKKYGDMEKDDKKMEEAQKIMKEEMAKCK